MGHPGGIEHGCGIRPVAGLPGFVPQILRCSATVYTMQTLPFGCQMTPTI